MNFWPFIACVLLGGVAFVLACLLAVWVVVPILNVIFG